MIYHKNILFAKHFFKNIYIFSKVKFIGILFLTVLLGASQSIGLTFLITTLSQLGLNQGGKSSRLQKVIDSLFQYFKLDLHLKSILIAFLIISLLAALLKYIHMIITEKVVYGFIQKIREDLFTIYIHETDKELLSKVSLMINKELNLISQGIITVFQTFGILILMGVYVFFAFFISWQITMIIFICAILIITYQRKLITNSYNIGSKSLQLSQKLQNITTKSFENFNQENSNEKNFIKLSKQNKDLNIEFGKVRAKLTLVFEISGALFLILTLYVSKVYYTISVTEILAMVYIFAKIFPQLKTLANRTQQILSYVPFYRDYILLIHKNYKP